MRAVHAAVVGITLSAAIVFACGGRGPLDDTPAPSAVVDAAVEDTAAEAAPVADATPDVGPVEKPVDAGAEGGIVECGTCLVDQCSQTILACVQNTSCRNIFQCVLTTCAGSGGLDPACLFGCASGDLSGLTQVFGVYQCLTETCGGGCNGVLGGLGGLGGGGGAKDAGKARAPGGTGSGLEKAFSPWPELFTPASHAAK